MSELTREEKIKLIEKLPEQLQDFMYSEDTGAFLLYLGEKYNLDDDKISSLSKIVGDIILKITPITSLAQEIVDKVTPDHQTAMAMAQELNSELLMPVLMPASAVTVAPAAPPAQAMPPATVAPTPIAPQAPVYQPMAPQTPIPSTPRTDQYREPISPSQISPRETWEGKAPEIVDLRKAPPVVSKVEAPPSMPMPPAASYYIEPPVTPKFPPPLTFTRPIEPLAVSPLTSLGADKVEPLKPTPLIEAEPHKELPKPTDNQRERPPVASPLTSLGANKIEPQFIVRPPGLAPIPTPHDVLDLRRDKGEF